MPPAHKVALESGGRRRLPLSLKVARYFSKKTGKPSFTTTRRLPKVRLAAPDVETGANRKVRSQLEKVCVQYFERHGIAYIYEPLLLLAGRQYRPDFFLPDYDLFIEICGFTHMPFYVDRMEEKRRQYAAAGLKAEFLVARRSAELLAQLNELLPKRPQQKGTPPR